MLAPKDVNFKDFLGQKNVGFKQILDQKRFWGQKTFGPKNAYIFQTLSLYPVGTLQILLEFFFF